MGYLEKLYDRNFMEYASYVIKDRAIPNIEDGLKPVQRRILHTLFQMDDGKFHKVANVVGACMKFHPHGDASIYSALVVLANKDMFIDKQGNFGNILTGDLPSAARYIECRLLPLATETMYNPEITAYEDSYDGRNQEPVTFPAKIPTLLIQGAEGIAVGMATKIMPHNLIEVLEAQIASLKGKTFQLYPDFPTGGLVDVSGYEDGNGSITVRAKLDVSDPKRILIRELPFGTNTANLIDSIEAAAKKNKIKISTINDYTTEDVEIEVKLPREVYAEDMVAPLYAFTDCEMSISPNLMVIKDNRPCVMSVTEVINYSAVLLTDVLKAELKIEEGKLRDRLHAKTLEQIFIENRIYKAIEQMKTQESVIKAVDKGLAKFKKQIKRAVTREDIERLLKIPIRRISLYDINKAKEEMKDIRARLREIAKLLKDLKGYAVSYLTGLIKKYKDQYPRRTAIKAIEKVDVREVARRDLKLRYDNKTGYLGYQIATGEQLLDVSSFDRILVIRKSGTWSVINAPDKFFVDRGMFYCGFVDKDIVFSMVYREEKTGFPYIKRCTIDKFILNKGYPLVPDGCKLLILTTEADKIIDLEYRPKPRVRILNESFKVDDYPVRGNKARGIRLANRDLKKVKFSRVGQGKSTKGGQTKLF